MKIFSGDLEPTGGNAAVGSGNRIQTFEAKSANSPAKMQ